MIDELMEKYLDMFGDSFPTMILARGKTDEETAEMIQSCIDAGKDVFEMGYIDDEDFLS